jgi:hypothetical protein
VTISSPADGATYTIGQPVAASYSCIDPGGSGVADCVGTVAQGAMVDTATAGPHSFAVTSHDAAGNVATATANYNVVQSQGGDVGGQTPATLQLTLGAPGAFAPFIPGIGHAYTTTVAARIISSAGDATLSAVDPSATQTGHLVNGAFFLSQPLEIAAAKDGAPAPTATTPIGGSANPTTLLTYDGPVNETATVLFKQPILDTEALRTGAYSKTLTFTLSTTNP